METLGALARKTLVRHGEKPAVKDSRGTITYAQLKTNVCQLAHALMNEGLTKGDRVAILMSNRREHVELDIAIALTGLIKVPINYRLHPKEFDYIVESSGSSLLIGEANLLENVSVPVKKLDVDKEYDLFISGHSDEFPNIEVGEDDLFALMYTSGTTGKPKGGMLTHRNMISGAISLNMVCEITYDDIIGHVAPLTHGSNFLSQCALFFGLKQVIFNKFDPKEFIDDLEREKISVIFLVPTLVNLMIHEENFDPHKLRYIKSINMAGAPMAVEKLNKALSLLGPKLAETYGLVEAPLTITMMPKEELAKKPDSCGAIGPFVEVRVVDENGNEVPYGEIGEVTCKGSLVMKGYWDNEKATNETLKDGWLYTGDLGWIDEKGYLRLVDRAKDMIITGGLNVYPREVEEVLNQHPDVKETCVFGVPDEKWGESIYAHVVLSDETQQVNEEELIELCKNNLASYKKPRKIEIVKELPKNSYGKILRKALRDQYQLQG
ncbi:class I adenylate-forming enzyme family protein [Alkalihalobacterium alkalinitrilicum]|uniref:class I adenylate-forming enzyme family protein n=1 Tax=Alkalihalobacterium alkalinitrilicum TaxID=427920 RepID=UPI000994F657|nr:AMP-binding protein [Alkalihalobacterium alkalinitrilicum]